MDVLGFMEKEKYFELEYDEGPIIWNGDKEHPDSRPYKKEPWSIFTISSQHVRGATLKEALRKAMEKSGGKTE